MLGIDWDVFPKEQPHHLAKDCNSMVEWRSAGVSAGKRGDGLSECTRLRPEI